MPNIAKILLIGGGFATATSVAGTGFYFYSQPRNIGELLNKKGKTLLSFDNEEHWKRLATKHRENKDPIQIKDGIIVNKIKELEISQPQDSNPIDTKALKDKCKSFFETAISKGTEFDAIVNNAENWCTLQSPVLEIN